MSIVCRICGTEIPIDQDLCPNCGRLKVNFPAILPDKLKNLFDEEKVRYEQDVKDREEKDLSSTSTEENLRKTVSEQKQKLKELENQKKEAETKSNELTDQLLAATNRADAAEETVAERTKEIQEIQKEKNELREQINANNVEKPLAFLVMMQGDSISALFGIYEGENSFGYMKSHDRHQQIICNAHVADNHFVIKATISTDSKGRPRTKFFVTPEDGRIYRSSNQANLISSEVELEKNECIYIDNVKFTLVVKRK